MTNEQQNIAIAEWCGREYHKPTEQEKKSGSYYQYEPDYLNDLNAMQSAIEKLDEKQRFRFVEILEEVQKPLNTEPWHWVWNLATAKCEPLAEALLKTIGKWQEE